MKKLTKQNAALKALCAELGLNLKPWEFPPPWELSDEDETNPHPSLVDSISFQQIIALRLALKAELKARTGKR